MNLTDLKRIRLIWAARLSVGLLTAGGLMLCAILLLAAGCTAPAPITEEGPAPFGTVLSPATATPNAPNASVTVTTNSPLALVWWGPEFISPDAKQPAGPLMAEQLAEFSRASDGKISVTLAPKARYGKGGLLDFLRTAAPVAPAILPDLIALDVSELEAATATGLLQPLDELLDDNVINGLYPFAVSAGRFGEHVLAVQYVADLDHLVYRRDLVKMPPATWQELLAEHTRYLLPLSSQQSSASGQPAHNLPDVLLSQYLSAGATYDLTTRKLSLASDPLQRLFTFYQTAIKSGVFPEDAAQVLNADRVWSDYSHGSAPLADVGARRYLAEGGNLKGTSYAAAPGQNGPLKPVASGWALAITTTDPARQRATASLIAWLLAPERQGAWTAKAGWLPTAPAAIEQWDQSEYIQFLATQLADAVSLPIGPDSALAATQLKQGWESVIKGESSPAAATEAILNPPK